MSSEKEVIKGVKKWVKTHDPAYLQKRKEYANREDVKLKRSILNKRRRSTAASAINLIKNKTLKDRNGCRYKIDSGRLIMEEGKELFVIHMNKNGETQKIPIDPNDTLEEDKYDVSVFSTDKPHVKEKVLKLFEGDPEIETAVREVKKYSKAVLPDEDCYWKKLDDFEKKELLSKLN